MEIIGPIATKISDYVIDAIFHELGYLVYYKDNMKGLKEQTENLVSARSRVQHLIDEAKDKAEDVEDDVHNWLTKVDEITEETYKFLINIAEEKEKKCINGLCLNIVRRHRLSRKAKKWVEELAHIQDQGKFDKVSYRGPLPKLENISNYVTFESRLSILKEMIETLKDPNVNMIGVHGMGGIGKTMLVKDVSCQVTKSKLFELVIVATVGQNEDVKHIQGQLADMLNLSFGQETEQGRAALLRKRLQMEKSILVVLDDIWNGLDLETVGIPWGDDYKGCKILVTSRSIHVLSYEMNIEKNFEIKNLTEEESWDFFKSMMGKSSEITNLEWKKIAIKVAEKCGKLPIALATVAKALRGKRLHAWKDALRQLNNPATVDIQGVSKQVYVSLRLSYDNLNCLEAKLLFLLCSMFPDDYDINKDILARYALGLKFLQGVDTLETTRDRIFTLVDDLESSCMLQKSEKGSKYVKMHDVVRDVAIYISSKNDQMCTLSYGKGLDMWRDEDTHGHYTAVLASCTDFHDLPTKLRFPKLELLTLVRNVGYGKGVPIPEEFFEGMEKLKVLHLEYIYFPQPPSYFHCMVNLRTLMLVDCDLENVDMIVELKNLEILDISGSKIKDLPLSTGQLSRLKELNLSYCDNLKVIQPEIISKLTKLEVLLIRNGYEGWDEVEGSSKKENASLVELQHLPCLTALYISVPSVKQLPKKAFSNNPKLEEFKIMVGFHYHSVIYETNKVLDINLKDRNVVLEEGVRLLLKKAEELLLSGPFGVRDALHELNGSDVLRLMDFEYDEEVEYLVSTEMVSRPVWDSFRNLEKLRIRTMKRLKKIIHIESIEKVKVFENLKRMLVENCHKLKYLLPFSIMEGLLHLEEIVVKNCNMMEAIVIIENEDRQKDDKIERRKLSTLIMLSLPQLISFYGKIVEDGPTESEIVEEDQKIGNLITPYEGQAVFPDLNYLEFGYVASLRDYQLNVEYNFNNLETIDLADCKNVKSIFAYKTMMMLKELRKLIARNCDSLEEIFNMNEIWLNEEGDFVPFSSKLKILELRNLPNLKQVWNVKDQDEMLILFPSLIQVEVLNCPKLTRLFPSSFTKHLHQLKYININGCGIDRVFSKEESELEYSTVSFPNLESLKIKSADNLEMIWQDGLIIDDLSNLKLIQLHNCISLKSVVTLNVMRQVKELEELCIRYCDSLEEIFKIDQKQPQEEEAISFMLKEITLRNLPSLNQVWNQDFDGVGHFPYHLRLDFIGCPKLRKPLPTRLHVNSNLWM